MTDSEIKEDRLKSKFISQRIIVPGGLDRVTSPPLSRTAFERSPPGRLIPVGGGKSIRKGDCFWDERHDTISVHPELGHIIIKDLNEI